jgi:hypothetical protein
VLHVQVQSEFFSPDDADDGGDAAADAQSEEDVVSDDGLADESGSDEEV